MGDSVVADFVTDVIPDTGQFDEPVRGRVVMNRKEVVIATPNDRVSFAIEDVFDLAYGSAPAELREFFEDTVSVAYTSAGRKRVALIEGADETVTRFTNLLFKGILNDTPVVVKHPAKIGGRITEESYQRATLFVDSPQVKFKAADPFVIDVSTVSHFERIEREVSGQRRSVLSVRHADGGSIATTEIALQPERKMNVLGRYLRIEYSQLREDLEEVSLQDEEIEILIGLYSGASEGNLAGMLGVDTARVSTMLRKLEENGLLEDTASGWTLSPTGKLAVGEHLEEVNL